MDYHANKICIFQLLSVLCNYAYLGITHSYNCDGEDHQECCHSLDYLDYSPDEIASVLVNSAEIEQLEPHCE